MSEPRPHDQHCADCDMAEFSGITYEAAHIQSSGGEYIQVSPRDEDGDIVVSLKGRPRCHLSAHGPTLSDALRMLADLVELDTNV